MEEKYDCTYLTVGLLDSNLSYNISTARGGGGNFQP